jgi:hypothetical protein
MGQQQLPAVDVLHDCECVRFSMLENKVLIHPCDNMILERAFDNLMKKVRQQKLVNIGTRKIVRKWLLCFSAM